MTNCFEGICSCNCNDEVPDFDLIIKAETNFNVTLRDLSRQNIGWFIDRNTDDDHMIVEWKINDTEGLYFLWWKEGYCPDHDLFHMTCKYVGKGKILKRIISHWQEKDFSEEVLVYFTYLPLENRAAKYVEQLIMDIYDIPLNKSENRGKHKLCAYFTQNEVD